MTAATAKAASSGGGSVDGEGRGQESSGQQWAGEAEEEVRSKRKCWRKEWVQPMQAGEIRRVKYEERPWRKCGCGWEMDRHVLDRRCPAEAVERSGARDEWRKHELWGGLVAPHSLVAVEGPVRLEVNTMRREREARGRVCVEQPIMSWSP